MIQTIKGNLFLKNSIINATGTFLSGIFGYLFHFFISKKISVAQYGELQTLLSLFTILSVISIALNYFMVQHGAQMAKQKDYMAIKGFMRGVYKKLLPSSLALLLLLFIISPFISAIFHLTDIWGSVIVSLAVLFTILPMVEKGMLTALEDFLPVSALNIITALLKLVSGVLLVQYFLTASMLSTALFLGAFSAWILALYYRKTRISCHMQETTMTTIRTSAPLGNVKKTIIPIFLFSLLITVLNNVDILLVKSLTTPDLAGFYSALTTLGKIIFWINSSIVLVILPHAVITAGAKKRLGKKTLLFSYGSILLITGCATLSFFLFPRFLISILFNPQYTIYADKLWYFGLITGVFSLLTLEANFAFARKDKYLVPILFLVCIFLTGSIILFHQSIDQIIASVLITFTVGYLLTLLSHIGHNKNLIVTEQIFPA